MALAALCMEAPPEPNETGAVQRGMWGAGLAACAAAHKSLKSRLHGARDCSDALLDERRGLANVSDCLAAIVEDAYVPPQSLLAIGAERRLTALVLVR